MALQQKLNEPAMRLRKMDLSPKAPEDNYALSERGGDSDAEEEPSTKDRSKKVVPKWCETYMEDLVRQADVDPDTIFTDRVPQCVLEDVFPDSMYTQIGK